jgi:ribose transport system permease protein
LRPARRLPLADYLIYVVFAGICVALAILIRVREGSWVFASQQNLTNIGVQTIPYALVAVGMTFVILTAGIDLSVGGIIAFTGVFGSMALMRWSVGVPGAIVVGVAAGVSAGAVNGLMITRFNIPPFVATLAMWLIAGYTGGLAFLLNQGRPVWGLPDRFTRVFTEPLLGVPPIVLLVAAAIVVGYLILTRTRFGRNVYAVGGNEEAARLSGVPVRRVLVLVYAVSGLAAGLGGCIQASQLDTGTPNCGLMYEMYVIAAVVVGGTSLSGGSGRILGTLIGAFIISVIQNGMNLLGIESYTQNVVLGLVILGAVLLDKLREGVSA